MTTTPRTVRTTVKTLGILGTGTVGRTLARAWAKAGHTVLLGSRRPGDPEVRALAAREAGERVTLVDSAAAVTGADVVVNATPGTVSVELLSAIGEAALADRVLLDVAVGFTEDFSLSHPGESLGEEIQRTFPRARVVKTLCTVDRNLMVAPDSLEGPSTLFLSGEDTGAKETVRGLLRDLGWPDGSLLDLGGIGTARGQEHFSLLFMGVAEALGDYGFGIRVVPPAATR
ncbi:NAD(P)-binding domain-containing protein [Streptomyces sp. NPDC005805]|uniref:NADPH-dependent F420 reductase n=1 Tax=Streptomyces sp. NPDC005805 TaxID=3157068 RepID=UPI0033DFB18E